MVKLPKLVGVNVSHTWLTTGMANDSEMGCRMSKANNIVQAGSILQSTSEFCQVVKLSATTSLLGVSVDVGEGKMHMTEDRRGAS